MGLLGGEMAKQQPGMRDQITASRGIPMELIVVSIPLSVQHLLLLSRDDEVFRF
jgi:hypothetical protein